MPQAVTLQLPEHLLSLAAAEARRTSRPLETVLVEWLELAGREEVTSLSDDELLALCDGMMDSTAHEELSELLSRNREGELDKAGRRRLSELMGQYQQGLLRKSRAWKVAVARGLKLGLE